MVKTAKRIRLVTVVDASQAMCIHAILVEGRFASNTMNFHLIEWNGISDEIRPGLLVNLDGAYCKYFAEWGDNDGWRDKFEFSDQPLAIGQLVTRTYLSQCSLGELIYRVDDIVDLLA
jgi:hypothetical protein